MSKAYYQEEQWLAQVDKEDNIIGKVEKWDAHKRAILHRGYTVILECNDAVILQHRKHPVFDGVYDLSFSSHQLYKNGTLQTDEEAIYEGLKREWGVDKQNINELKFLSKIYYKSRDLKSEYFEHEVDYIYLVTLNKMPIANREYAYGQEMVEKKNISSTLLPTPVAPWIDLILMKKII